MTARTDPAQPTPPPPRQLSGWRASYLRFASKPAVMAVAAAILITIGTVNFIGDASPEPAPAPGPAPLLSLSTPDIQAQIRDELSVQLVTKGTLVQDVTCTRDSDTHATCEAELSGEQAGTYPIDVRIDPKAESIDWLLAGSPEPR